MWELQQPKQAMEKPSTGNNGERISRVSNNNGYKRVENASKQGRTAVKVEMCWTVF